MSQGKRWNKRKVIAILKPYFQRGCSVQRACDYAGIPRTTVQTWVEKDEVLRLQITAWQNTVNVQARENVAEAVLKGKDVGISQWWLQKKEADEFMDRSANINTEMTVEEFAKRFEISEE